MPPPTLVHGCCPFVLFLSFAASSLLRRPFRMSLSLLSLRVSFSSNLGSSWHRGYLLTPTLSATGLAPTIVKYQHTSTLRATVTDAHAHRARPRRDSSTNTDTLLLATNTASWNVRPVALHPHQPDFLMRLGNTRHPSTCCCRHSVSVRTPIAVRVIPTLLRCDAMRFRRTVDFVLCTYVFFRDFSEILLRIFDSR